MELKEAIKKYDLKEVSTKELIEWVCKQANKDFKDYGITYYNNSSAWDDDISKALNNGEFITYVDNKDILYYCTIELGNARHTEVYGFYALSIIKDNVGEEYDIKFYI